MAAAWTGLTPVSGKLDDVGVEEPSCSSDSDCARHMSEELQPPAPRCERGWCLGHNERVNVWRAGKHFIKQFLPLGAPAGLKPRINQLLVAYTNATWSASRILTATEELVMVFSTGQYLQQQPRPLGSSENDIPGNNLLTLSVHT